MLGRIVIDDVRPRTPGGYPAKAVVGETVTVSADVFRDGHDILGARICWRPEGSAKWNEEPMAPVGNDRWEGAFTPAALGAHAFAVEAWTDAYLSWRHRAEVKLAATASTTGGTDPDLEVELVEGARILAARAKKVSKEARAVVTDAVEALCDTTATPWARLRLALSEDVAALAAGPLKAADVTRSRPQPLWVDRERALFGAWYEAFPRSFGGLAGLAGRLERVAAMGFDVLYLPPIHPIGRSHRKGRNNTLVAGPDDPGSPWAIGSPDGGHTAIEPSLGTFTDFGLLVHKAGELGMEVALDYALQCSPDHPWVAEHPEWFHRRADGSIAYAENPPKKYQDIFPINFWPEKEADRVALWDACRDILLFWIERGVRIFRVDNPHTKPLAFWEWVIADVQRRHPEGIFLAEAFTRPKVMSKLAEVGFSQSYTYFTWRVERWELEEYVREVTAGPAVDWFRPSFWPSTPDILSGPLRHGNRAAFQLRLVLAALLAPTYGMYSGYELCENEPASETNEEFLASEKYELKERDFEAPGSLGPFVTTINEIRRRHPACTRLRNVTLHGSTSERLLVWSRRLHDDVVLIVVNLDPHHVQEATLRLDLDALGVPGDRPFEVFDELSGHGFTWHGAEPYVRLDPALAVAHVLHVRPVPAP